jgi:hypothetical protein
LVWRAPTERDKQGALGVFAWHKSFHYDGEAVFFFHASLDKSTSAK